MKKYIKFIFPAICIIIVVVTFVLLLNLKNKVEEKNYNVDEIEFNSVEETNIVNNASINENENESVENTQVSSSTKNEVENESRNELTASSVYEEANDVGSTDKKQEAIDLVKQKWGEDNTVAFRCDSVTGNGEYIIAVISKKTASVKNYFRVNLEKNTVEIDY